MITQGMCVSFKRELFEGVHDFTSDTFKLALYVSTANLHPSTTTAYTSSGETTGDGYTAGGISITAVAPTTSGLYALCDFDDATFSSVSITARGGLIYNSSKSNRAVAIIDFGIDKTKTASDLIVRFPSPDTSNAILRIV